MSRKDNPDLAPDAALASDLGDPVERHAAQVAEMGGDIDDIDSFDPTGLDDGSDPDYVPPEKEEDNEDAADSEVGDGDEDDTESDSDDADDESSDDESSDEGDGDEADAEEDGADEDEADTKPAAKGIPKYRFDEVNEEKNSLRDENARLKAQIEAGKPPEDQAEPFDIRAGEKEYMDLLLDGDTEAALGKREEIDAAKEAKWKSETTAETKTDLHSDAEKAELIGLSQEAETMFDVFNPKHTDYNQDLLNKVMVFMRGYESTGEMSRGDAFVAGLADVVEMYDLMPEEGAADDVEPQPTGKKKVDPKKKKLKEGAHIPVGGEGSSSADTGAVAPSVDDMTDEELDALPEKTLARMRGDTL